MLLGNHILCCSCPGESYTLPKEFKNYFWKSQSRTCSRSLHSAPAVVVERPQIPNVLDQEFCIHFGARGCWLVLCFILVWGFSRGGSLSFVFIRQQNKSGEKWVQPVSYGRINKKSFIWHQMPQRERLQIFQDFMVFLLFVTWTQNIFILPALP